MQNGKNVILCVDDDPTVLVALKVVLESGGFAVVTAADGQEGIRAFRQARPDLVILDLMMEEVDAGIKVLKEMQELDDRVPIYMLSSTGDYLYSTADTDALGIAGVFQKPIDPNILLSLIRAKLAQR
jgi:DNA-binding response OmpR family regulator